MLVVTTNEIPGVQIQPIGLVRGNVSMTRNFGRDLMAAARNLVGGEVKSYTGMANDARKMAEDRMIAEAEACNADAVVAMRFDSEELTQGIIDMLAYGTAVRFIR